MKKNAVIAATATAVLLLGIGVFYFLNQSKDTTTRENTPSSTGQSTTEQPSKKDVREVVWEQMSEQQKATVDGTWTDGTVSKTTLEGVNMVGVKDKTYEGKEVFSIQLPRKQGDTLGDVLTVFADVETYNLLGYGVLD